MCAKCHLMTLISAEQLSIYLFTQFTCMTITSPWLSTQVRSLCASKISRLMILKKLLRAKIPKRRGVHPWWHPLHQKRNTLCLPDKGCFFSTKCALRHMKRIFGAWSDASHREVPAGVGGTLNFTSCVSTILHSGIAAALPAAVRQTSVKTQIVQT